MDHIHEWRRGRSLCKMKLDDSILLDWFLKSLLYPIAKDVAQSMPQTEEEVILTAKKFDLIYAQSGYLYTVIPDAPCNRSTDLDKPRASHAADGVIRSIAHGPANHFSGASTSYNQNPYGYSMYCNHYGGPNPSYYQNPYRQPSMPQGYPSAPYDPNCSSSHLGASTSGSSVHPHHHGPSCTSSSCGGASS